MLRVSSILYLQRVWSRPSNVIVRETSNNSVQQETVATIDNASIPDASLPQAPPKDILESLKKSERKEQVLQDQQCIDDEHERLKQERLKNEQDLFLITQERQKREKELETLQLERQKLEQEEQLQRMKRERQKEEEQRDKIRFERQRKILQDRQEEEDKQTRFRLEEERLEQERLHEERLFRESLLVVTAAPTEQYPVTKATTPPPSITGDNSCSSSSTNLFERTLPAMSHETSFHPYNLPLIQSRQHPQQNQQQQQQHDRDYYDDDLSSDLDSEHIIDQLPTPPSTPNKFSPKRILHKAKSSITDDSVRNLGRRTSLFLEKKLTPSTSDDFSITSMRRQSSKISGKGKSFTKKLKRVLSFHQS
ncbi:uncharacterized protein EV154DRAFT_577427 [Mucor mucedo]|uniref:uncharacterized protein n=1 Tax=Mucor mucedo TaxID=29922 RepID=UPI00222121F9|nr:uncharacterized protein EV154DRAFT_577427 [Mucor mucedo]KAI7894676.1 hypothetical protein EV154DRAFT_577427 [Mucor mucedo]